MMDHPDPDWDLPDGYAPDDWYDGADPDAWGGPDIDPNWFDTQEEDRGERMTTTKQPTTYEATLRQARKVGAAQADDAGVMALFCEDVLQIAVGAAAPKLGVGRRASRRHDRPGPERPVPQGPCRRPRPDVVRGER